MIRFLQNKSRALLLLLLALAATAISLQPFAMAQFDTRAPESPQIIFQSGFEASESTGVIPFVPPNPISTWVPLDPSKIPTFHDTVEFLYSGPNPVQRGMQGDPIQPYRATVMRGRVINEAGAPLPGVLVRIHSLPAHGYTFTRADGYYDLVSNGGLALTLDFSKQGFLRSQRKQFAAWKSFTLFDDIVLLQPSSTASIVTLPNASPQIADGPISTDTSGPRRPSVYFPSGVSATAVLANGTQTPLPQLTFRATEYTVGAKGEQRMPGSLPSNIAYTYAVELAADEATALGASKINFSAPVSLYLDNFLDVKIGEAIPLAYYDFVRASWIGEQNGHVAKVIGLDGAMARIDLIGLGVEATAAEYLRFNISSEERAAIAQRFTTGKSFWRSRIRHFTAWDANFTVWPDLNTQPPPPTPQNPPNNDPPEGPNPENCNPICPGDPPPPPDLPTNENDDEGCGSILSCQDRTLREHLPLAGTSDSLMYASDRTRAHGTSIIDRRTRTIKLTLADATLPLGLQKIEVTFETGGKWFQRRYDPQPNLTDEFPVSLGNVYYPDPINRRADYKATICNQYIREYGQSFTDFSTFVTALRAGWNNFASRPLTNSSGLPIQFRDVQRGGGGRTMTESCVEVNGSRELPIVRKEPAPLFLTQDQRSQALGGLGLTSRHSYDPESGTLFMGDGTRTKGMPLEGGFNSFGAIGAGILEPMPTVNVTGFGNLDAEGCYTNWQNTAGPTAVLTRQCPSGVVQTPEIIRYQYCVPDFYNPNACDGIAGLGEPIGVIITPAGQYFTFNTNGIYAIGPNGTRVVYRVDRDFDRACSPAGIAPYGDTIVVACNDPNEPQVTGPWIATVDPDGRLVRIAGGGTLAMDGDPLKLKLDQLQSIRANDAGAIYAITVNNQGQNRALRFGGSFRTSYLAPQNRLGILLNAPKLIAPGNDGYYWLDQTPTGDVRVHAVGHDNKGQLILDPSAEPYIESEFVPQLAFLNAIAQRTAWRDVTDMNLGPDGSLFMTREGGRLFRYGRSRTYYRGAVTGFRIPSADRAMVYVFDKDGRHLETRRALTGALMERFVLNSAKQVIQVIDGDDETLTIDRISAGLIRFTAPYGQITEMKVNGFGLATSLKHLATQQEWKLDYLDEYGLLSKFTKPKGNFADFVWDNFSRLEKEKDSGGGEWDLRGYSNPRYKSESNGMNRLDGKRLYRYTYNDKAGTTRYKVKYNFNQTLDVTSSNEALQNFSYHYPGEPPHFIPPIESVSRMEPDLIFGFSAPALVETQTKNMPYENGTYIVLDTKVNRTVTPISSVSRLGEINRLELTDITGVNRIPNQIYSTLFRRSSRQYNAITKTWTAIRAGVRTVSKLDAQERTLQKDVEGIAAVRYQYNARGRLEQVASGTGADERIVRLEYDSAGYVNKLIDPLNREVLILNDSIGRALQMTLPDKRMVEFEYDPNNNVTGIKPPGRLWHRFEYGQQDELKQYLPPVALNTGTNSTRYSYNKVPQLNLETRPGAETLSATFTNTLLRDLTVPTGVYSMGYSGSRPVSMLTPPQADTCRIAINTGYVGYFPRVSEWRRCGAEIGKVARVQNNFNELGSITVTSPVANGVLEYGIERNDAATANNLNGGRLSALRFGTTPDIKRLQFQFLPGTFNPLLQGTVLEKVKDTWAYNQFGESSQYLAQTTIDPQAPLDLFKQVFTRDKLGRITTKTETVAGITTAYSYGYDLAGRLETVSTNGVLSKTFGFDSNSNRTSLITSAGTITGVADAQDRLLSYGSNVYTYAANGELATRTKAGVTRSFSYDLMGNLTSVSEPTTLNLKYGFDAQNRRISRIKNNVVTHSWLYLDQLRIAAELNADGSLKQQFAYGEKMNVPSVILRPEQNGTVLYRVISDHLGSVRLVVNAETGAVAQRMRYDEYGQVLEDTNPGFQPFGYAGGLYDPDTGLVRFGARDYDPEIGRWLAKDPIRFGGKQSNIYIYVSADPINNIDPSGKVVPPVVIFFAALIVGEGLVHAWDHFVAPEYTDTDGDGQMDAADDFPTQVPLPFHEDRDGDQVPNTQDTDFINECRAHPGLPECSVLPPPPPKTNCPI